jgi:hypothetical protein
MTRRPLAAAPSKFKPEYVEQARKLTLLGCRAQKLNPGNFS